MGLIVSTLGGWIATTYAIIVSAVTAYFVVPVTAFVTLPLYTDSEGRKYNIFLLFLFFCLLTTFALSALLYGGAFFMIATVIYGWVILFRKLKEFRKKNK